MGLNLGNMFNKKNQKSSNPFGGIIVGIILLIAGTCLLWWNEGNNVKNIQTVKEVSKAVVDVSSDEVNSENDGKVVCTNGNLEIADEALIDPVFSLSQKTAKLTRIVEMYQWDEESHTDSNDNTTYSYTKKWASDIIDSSNFHESGHTNNATMPYTGESYYASNVSVGKFNLSQDQIKGLSTNKELSLGSDLTLPEGFKVEGIYITNADDMNNPNVGDIRVSYKCNDYTSVSVLAVQKGNSFVTFTSKSGKNVNRVEGGILTSAQIINEMKGENNAMKWVMRLIGVLVIIFGYMAVVSLISKIASFVPILGRIVGAALGVVCFLVGLVHSLIVIAIAWIRFRPLLGIGLLAAAAALAFVANKYVKKTQTE